MFSILRKFFWDDDVRKYFFFTEKKRIYCCCLRQKLTASSVPSNSSSTFWQLLSTHVARRTRTTYTQTHLYDDQNAIQYIQVNQLCVLHSYPKLYQKHSITSSAVINSIIDLLKFTTNDRSTIFTSFHTVLFFTILRLCHDVITMSAQLLSLHSE